MLFSFFNSHKLSLHCLILISEHRTYSTPNIEYSNPNKYFEETLTVWGTAGTELAGPGWLQASSLPPPDVPSPVEINLLYLLRIHAFHFRYSSYGSSSYCTVIHLPSWLFRSGPTSMHEELAAWLFLARCLPGRRTAAKPRKTSLPVPFSMYSWIHILMYD